MGGGGGGVKMSFRDPHAKIRNRLGLPIAIPNGRIPERYMDKALPMLKKFYDSFSNDTLKRIALALNKIATVSPFRFVDFDRTIFSSEPMTFTITSNYLFSELSCLEKFITT